MHKLKNTTNPRQGKHEKVMFQHTVSAELQHTVSAERQTQQAKGKQHMPYRKTRPCMAVFSLPTKEDKKKSETF